MTEPRLPLPRYVERTVPRPQPLGETDAKSLTGVLTVLKSINTQDLDYELRKLQGIKEWALTHLGIDYRAGNRVRITSPTPGQSKDGWAHKAECLHVGATGVVRRIEFALPFGDRPGRWFADFVPDREWSTSQYGPGETRRYWKGRADETPDGYEPPSKYDAEHHPNGRRHTFMFDVEWLALEPSDRPGSQDGSGAES